MPYTRCILSAEDDADDRLLIRASLNRVGLDIPIEFVSDGRALLHRLGEIRHDGSRWPRSILLDLNMPGMGGEEVLKLLKGDPHLRWLPVTIFTTSGNEAHRDGCYRSGANAFVVKPSTLSDLNVTMSTLVRFWYDVVRVPERPEAADGAE